MPESNEVGSVESSLSAEIWEIHRQILEVDAIIKVVAKSLTEQTTMEQWSLFAASRALNEIASDIEPGTLFANVGLDYKLAVDQPLGYDPTDSQGVANG